MNERTTTLAAGVVALLLVGGVAGLTFRRSAANPGDSIPRVLSQKLLPPMSSQAARAETIELKLLPPQTRRGPEDDEIPIEYQIVDRRGRIYAATASSGTEPIVLRFPRTYGRTVEAPRLITLLNGKPQGSVDLAPFPEPVLRSLSAARDPRLRAFVQVPKSTLGAGKAEPVLVFQTRSPFPKDELWELRVLETNLQPPLGKPGEAVRFDPAKSRCQFAAIYADDIQAVRIRVERYRRRIVSEEVTVRGLRLTRKKDEIAVRPQKPIPIPNRLGIKLAIEDPPPPKPTSDSFPNAVKNPRHASLYLAPNPRHIIAQAPDKVVSVYEGGLPGQLGQPSQPKLPGQTIHAQLLSPKLEDLGLEGLGPWNPAFQMSSSRKPTRALHQGPFDLRLRLYKCDWDNIGAFETTIPVEKADVGSTTAGIAYNPRP